MAQRGQKKQTGQDRQRRQFKDRLFRFLFRDKRDLLSLYNALNGSDYGDPDELEVTTVEGVIFMGMKNDLSFIVGGDLNLYEHQSTYSPNMPLRGLLYFAQQYEGLLAGDRDRLYGRRRVTLPTPRFVVFYNGTDWDGEGETLHLSDSFTGGRGSGCLECSCLMLNINRGHNEQVLGRCRRLHDYSELGSKIHDHIAEGMGMQEAVGRAIDECIEQDILRDVLLRQKAEVMGMILTEYDEKAHMRTVYAEGYEDGEAAGLMSGEHKKLRELVGVMYGKGLTAGEIAGMIETPQEEIERIIAETGDERRP